MQYERCGCEHNQEHDEEVVAPIPGAYQGNGDGDRNREYGVDDCSLQRILRNDEHSTGHPQCHQCGKRWTRGRRQQSPFCAYAAVRYTSSIHELFNPADFSHARTASSYRPRYNKLLQVMSYPHPLAGGSIAIARCASASTSSGAPAATFVTRNRHALWGRPGSAEDRRARKQRATLVQNVGRAI